MIPKVAAGDHHRHDREAVEAVGQIDRIAGGDDDESTEDEKEKPEVGDKTVEGRQGESCRVRRPEFHHRRNRRRRRSRPSKASRRRPEKPLWVCFVTFR